MPYIPIPKGRGFTALLVRPKYDLKYEASIIEYVFEHKIPLDKALVIFKLPSYAWIHRKLKKRRESGVPLYMDADSKIVKIPSNLENLNYRPMITKAKVETTEAKVQGKNTLFSKLVIVVLKVTIKFPSLKTVG